MAKKKTDILPKKELIENALAIYEHMVDGSNDQEIMEDLDLTTAQFMECKRFLLRMKADEIEQSSSAEVFGRYLIAQEQNVKDLNDLISNLNHKTQYNALVGAIRLRADITDRIIERGQSLGVIEKEPEKRVIVAGVNVHEIKDRDLKKGIVKAIGGLQKLIKRYGDMKLSDLKVDGSLHYGEAAQLPAETTAELGPPEIDKSKKPKGKARAKSNKRSAGRRRTRE